MAATCLPCPDCGDSPLSTTGNILGILTFALGLFLSTVAFMVAVRSAETEIDDLIESLKSTGRYIDQMTRFFASMGREADPEMTGMGLLPSDATESISNTQTKLLDELEETKKTISELPTRVDWWYRAQDVKAKLSKLDSERQHLHSVQLALLVM
ncbi:unnamed protein product [Fusarium graminearum]|nr:unnamed protein product [Fusarium graminearum]CAG2001700.1 unnamed protein product [Fusarium graminearum]